MDKNFVCEAGDYYLELVPAQKEHADWVSIDEYNRLLNIAEAAYERMGCGCGGDHGLCNFCSKVVDDLQKALGK